MIDLLKDLFHPLFDLLAATLTTFHGWGRRGGCPS
jgi:hypothetical protein